jgi:hypothetical protein
LATVRVTTTRIADSETLRLRGPKRRNCICGYIVICQCFSILDIKKHGTVLKLSRQSPVVSSLPMAMANRDKYSMSSFSCYSTVRRPRPRTQRSMVRHEFSRLHHPVTVRSKYCRDRRVCRASSSSGRLIDGRPRTAARQTLTCDNDFTAERVRTVGAILRGSAPWSLSRRLRSSRS